jgi:hypothetical protein
MHAQLLHGAVLLGTPPHTAHSCNMLRKGGCGGRHTFERSCTAAASWFYVLLGDSIRTYMIAAVQTARILLSCITPQCAVCCACLCPQWSVVVPPASQQQLVSCCSAWQLTHTYILPCRPHTFSSSHQPAMCHLPRPSCARSGLWWCRQRRSSSSHPAASSPVRLTHTC